MVYILYYRDPWEHDNLATIYGIYTSMEKLEQAQEENCHVKLIYKVAELETDKIINWEV